MLDEDSYDDGLSMEENCKLELKRLRESTRQCGTEVLTAFARRFRMNVRVLSASAPPHVIHEIGATDTAVVWYNGVDHYGSVMNFESRHADRRPSPATSE